MTWAHRFELRQQVMGSLWLVPLLCAAAGPGVAAVTLALDDHVELPTGLEYSDSTATSVLSAVVGAMVGLTGFVVAFGVLIVQMATQTLSPRYMRLWYRDPLQKAVLGMFLGTLTYSYALLRHVDGPSVPHLGVTLAGFAMTASLILFLLYLDHFVHRLRPVAVAGLVGGAGARVFTAREPRPAADASAPPWRAGPSPPALRVGAARAGAIQAIDRRGLVATAVAHDCVLRLPRAVGDFVTTGTVIVEVHGGGSPPSAAGLLGAVAIGGERTIEQDPAFALRILVDIAIRALSPAVNDPTTAVQVLNYIEELLQLLGTSELRQQGELRDAGGRVRVVVVTPGWEEYMALGITEIRHYGVTSVQLTRRLRAVLESLRERVRPEHRPAVERELGALDAAVARAAADGDARRFAAAGDRQGIGGTPGATAEPPPPPASALGG